MIKRITWKIFPVNLKGWLGFMAYQTLRLFNAKSSLYCDDKLTKIPKRDFIFARVKTGQVGTWSLVE